MIYLHWKKGWFLYTDLQETVISGVQLNCFIVQCKTPDELLNVFKTPFTTWVYSHWLVFKFTIPYIFVIFFFLKEISSWHCQYNQEKSHLIFELNRSVNCHNVLFIANMTYTSCTVSLCESYLLLQLPRILNLI